jgi:hypothetical protein
MKPKAGPKKTTSLEGDKFERRRAKKQLHKEKSVKHRLSIYDDFEENENWNNLSFNYNNDMDNSLND